MTFGTPIPKWSNEKASISENGRSASMVYQMTCDPTDTAVGARTATGIPRRGQAYTYNGVSDASMTVRTVTPARISPTFFEVAVEWSTPPGRSADVENPLDEPPLKDWDTVVSQEEYAYDADGNAIANVNGDPFDPPPQVDVYDLKLTVQRNQLTFDPAQALAYSNAINTDEFFGAAAGQVKCTKFRGKEVWGADTDGSKKILYFQVTLEFMFREGVPVQAMETGSVGGPAEAWFMFIQNTGLRERVSDSPLKLRRVKDSEGRPVQSPVPLDQHGIAITSLTDLRYYRSFRPAFTKRKAFADLGIT